MVDKSIANNIKISKQITDLLFHSSKRLQIDLSYLWLLVFNEFKTTTGFDINEIYNKQIVKKYTKLDLIRNLGKLDLFFKICKDRIKNIEISQKQSK